MQRLAGGIASLGSFISKLGERALPFFKLMKRSGPFKWTPEADAAFENLKRYLTSPPIMVAPRSREPLLLYLAATPHTASAALVAMEEEHTHIGGEPAEAASVPDCKLTVERREKLRFLIAFVRALVHRSVDVMDHPV